MNITPVTKPKTTQRLMREGWVPINESISQRVVGNFILRASDGGFEINRVCGNQRFYLGGEPMFTDELEAQAAAEAALDKLRDDLVAARPLPKRKVLGYVVREGLVRGEGRYLSTNTVHFTWSKRQRNVCMETLRNANCDALESGVPCRVVCIVRTVKEKTK